MASTPTPTKDGRLQGILEMASKILLETVSSTGGSGVSSTKVVWLSNGMLLCYSAALTTIGGVSVYLFFRKADPVYWAAVSALWTISVGFAVRAKNHQARIRKETINHANYQTSHTRASDQGGTP